VSFVVNEFFLDLPDSENHEPLRAQRFTKERLLANRLSYTGEPLFASFPDEMSQCFMQKLSYGLVTVTAAALMLVGNAMAQQTPPPTSQPSHAEGTQAGNQNSSTLTSQKDKVSYAIGMNIGTNLHRQSVDVDPKILQQGLEDSLAGGKTLLSEDEAKATLMQFQTEMRQKQQEKMQQAGAANKKEGDAFLAANKSKEGVVTLPSGLEYKILTAGKGPKPTASDSVVCNYRGTLIDGKEFDSSYKRGEPATFPVAGVIKGWTEALQLMPVGSKWQLFVPSDLAYAERGSGPDIGPNATLIFEVELLSIQSKDKAGDAEKK
jgi:FKBP-type peptidyl-prolyl cis-trans isomerase